jgi:phage shock protein PspC (stress-responsive transcriptional regulator)
MTTSQPFRRSTSDAMVAGVCGALAERLGLNSSLVRALAALLIVVTGGWALAAYLIAAIAIPAGNAPQSQSQWERRVAPRVRNKNTSRVLLAAVFVVLVLILSTSSFAGWSWLFIFPAIALLLGSFKRRSARVTSTQPSELDRAAAAWQNRLREIEAAAAEPPAAGFLPTSLAESINPPAQGFIVPARSPLDLPESDTLAADPWAAPSAPSGSASTPAGYTPAGYTPATGPSFPAWSPASGASAPSGPSVPLSPNPVPSHAGAYSPPAQAFATAGPRAGTEGAGVQDTALFDLGLRHAPGSQSIEVASFLAHAAPAPEPAHTAVAVRRRHPKAVGWGVVLLLAGAMLGSWGLFDDEFWTRPLLLAGAVSAALGTGLVVSPWLGRPKWLAPTTGVLLAAGSVVLLIFMLTNNL